MHSFPLGCIAPQNFHSGSYHKYLYSHSDTHTHIHSRIRVPLRCLWFVGCRLLRQFPQLKSKPMASGGSAGETGGRGAKRRKESSLIIPFELTVKVLLMWQSAAAAKQLISTAAAQSWACPRGGEGGVAAKVWLDGDNDDVAAGCNYNKKMISVWQIGKTFCGCLPACLCLPGCHFQLPDPTASFFCKL